MLNANPYVDAPINAPYEADRRPMQHNIDYVTCDRAPRTALRVAYRTNRHAAGVTRRDTFGVALSTTIRAEPPKRGEGPRGLRAFCPVPSTRSVVLFFASQGIERRAA